MVSATETRSAKTIDLRFGHVLGASGFGARPRPQSTETKRTAAEQAGEFLGGFTDMITQIDNQTSSERTLVRYRKKRTDLGSGRVDEMTASAEPLTNAPSPPVVAPKDAAPDPHPSVDPKEVGAPKAKMSATKKGLICAALGAVVLGGIGYWRYERRFEDTDDAQVDANISNISPRVSGTVTAVHVIENQQVKAGDVLAELDPSDLQVAVELAKAQVAEAEAQVKIEDPSVAITETSNKTTVATNGADLASAQAALEQAHKTVEQLAAQLAQAQASDKDAQLEKQRAKYLIDQGAISRSQYDQQAALADASAANVDALGNALEAARAGTGVQSARVASTRSRLAEAKANSPRQLETRRASVSWRGASLNAAKAQLTQAELNLSYARVISPVSGVVGKKSVSLGDYVSPGQQIIAVVATDDVWVTANFRETQLTKMHPGLDVTVHVDAIDQDLHGVVESVGGATGSRYSVLPPENASGNYVKVVQRIPVRVKIDPPTQSGVDRLRPGMSVGPKVRLW